MSYLQELKVKGTESTIAALREAGYIVDFNSDTIVVLGNESRDFIRIARIANQFLHLYKYQTLSTTKKEVMFNDCNDGGYIATIVKTGLGATITLK